MATVPRFSKDLGLRLQWAREVVEPNRAEFARGLKVDTSTIRNIENGSRNGSIQLLLAICHSLRISLNYLASGDTTAIDPWMRARLTAEHPNLARPHVRRVRDKPRKADRTGNNRQPRGQDHHL